MLSLAFKHMNYGGPANVIHPLGTGPQVMLLLATLEIQAWPEGSKAPAVFSHLGWFCSDDKYVIVMELSKRSVAHGPRVCPAVNNRTATAWPELLKF